MPTVSPGAATIAVRGFPPTYTGHTVSGLAAVQKAILARISTVWNELTVVAWPNAQFKPPNGPWLRVTILWGQGAIDTMGTTHRQRITGLVYLQVFVRKGTALGDLMAKMDICRDMFLDDPISGVWFSVPSGPAPDEVSDPEWMFATVTVPFEVTETT